MIGRHRRRIAWVTTALLTAAPFVSAATKDWSGGTGSWNVGSNWTPGGVPVSTDDVNLSQAGAVVTYIEPAAVSLHNVSIAAVGGTTLTQTQDALNAFQLTVGASTLQTGTYDFSGGSLYVQNATLITAGGVFTGSSNYNAYGLLRFSGGQMSGSGQTTVMPGQSLEFIGSANASLQRTLTNQGNATWAGTASINGSGTIINQGTFDITASSGLAFSLPTFNNQGTLHKISGTTTNFGGVCTFNNTGLVKVDTSTTLNINGSIPQRTGTTLTGGQWYVAGTLNTSGSGSTIDTINSGAAVTLDGSGSVFAPIDVLASNAGSFTVTGGRTFTPVGNLGNTGTLTVGSGSTVTLTGLTQLSAGTLSAGTYVIGGTLVLPSSVTTNQASITLNSGYVCAELSTLASNQGTFSVGASATYIAGGAFNNSGTASTLGGTLNLPSGGTQSGTFVASTGSISFSGGTHTFNNPTLSTPGALGSITISSIANITASANWTVAENTIWTGGTIGGTGKVLVPSGRQLKLQTGTSRTLSTTIENSGTMIWTGNTGLGGSGTITNLAGGSFEIQNTPGAPAIGVLQFNNAGTILKSSTGGSPASNFGGAMTLNNTGIVDVQSGTLSINGTITQATTSTLTAGTWKVSGTGVLGFGSGPSISTIGPAATVQLSGASSTFNKLSTLANNQGGFTITNGRNFTTVGALDNSGIINIGPNSTLILGGTLHNYNTLSLNDATSKLDIKNQKMVTVATYANTASLVQTGLITTTSNFAGLTTVAVAPANETGYVGQMFGGVLVSSGDTLAMYTLAGDADLNAVVNADDYFRIDSNYNKPPATLSYPRGDFNYDGVINGDDYALIDASFSGQGGFSPAPIAGITAVPEPASAAMLAILGTGAAAVLRRGRRDVPCGQVGLGARSVAF